MEIVSHKSAPLEQKQRLSRSLLWDLQRSFYERQGIEAWATHGLPHYITTNPFIADAYARVVSGFLRDWRGAGALDPAQPVHVVELGAGHGRFGYLFLKKFLALHRDSALGDVPVRYVMTDLTERNLEHWRGHKWLRPFVEEGLLDMARFDLERDRELRLVHSGETLRPGGVSNPVVLIANYVFDSVAQDAFHIEGGRLYESLVTVSSARKELDPADPEIFSRVETSYTRGPAAEDYYQDPVWNQILRDCLRRLPDTDFLFPVAALECLGAFKDLSGGRLLALSADKGYSRDDALLEGQGALGLAMHASFSMMVDYRIIGEFFRRHGGQAIHPPHRHQHLNVSAFLLGCPAGGCAETRLACREAIGRFGPDDFFSLVTAIDAGCDSFNLEQALAYLRLSGMDPHVLWRLLPALKRMAPSMSEAEKQDLYDAARQAWEFYFPMGESEDLAFQLGTLLYELQFYSEALSFLQHSVDLYGVEPGTAYNMAVCYYGLRQMAKALEWVDRALEAEPEFDAAKALRIKIQPAAGL